MTCPLLDLTKVALPGAVAVVVMAEGGGLGLRYTSDTGTSSRLGGLLLVGGRLSGVLIMVWTREVQNSSLHVSAFEAGRGWRCSSSRLCVCSGRFIPALCFL